MTEAVLIRKRATRFWDGEVILLERSHPLTTGERVHGFACILRHALWPHDEVSMYCCLGVCAHCVGAVHLGTAWHGVSRCQGARVTVNLPRAALMTRYKGPLPPPTHLIEEYP